MSETIHLGYWGIRGRGQIPRLLLAYTGAQWTQKKYFNQQQWKGIGKDQTSLLIPFPNLPYLIQGEFKLSQSRAIVNYIINVSNKKQLLGKNLKDSGLIQNLVSVLNEILGKSIELVMGVETYDKKLPQVQKFVEGKLESLQNLCKEHNFALGYLTLADFFICQSSYYIQNIFPKLYSKYSCLKRIREQFESVQQIRGYYARQDAVKGPFLPPVGKVKF